MAEKWVKNLIVASALAFCIYLGFGLILPLFPKYVELLKGGGLEVGILMASFMFTRAFLARPFGRLSDRIGRKKVIVTGMFLYGILAYLFTIPTHWSGLFLVRILQGTASAMVWPVGEALVVDSAPKEKRSRAISIYIFLTNIGIVAGPLIGAGILHLSKNVLEMSELTSIRTPFYFTSAIAFIGALIGLLFLKDILPPIKDKKKMIAEEKKALKLIRPIIRRSLYVLYTNSFFEGASWSLGSVVMFFFMQRNFGMDAIVFSALFGIAQGLGLLLVVPSGVLSDKNKKKPFVVWGSIGGRISTIIMSFTPAFPLGKWLAMIFYSGKDMGRQVAMPATRSLQADLVPEKIRGRLIGTIQAYSNIGAVLGPIAGGYIWDITNGRVFDIGFMNFPGDTIAFLLSASMGIFAALLVQRYVYEPPKGKTIG
jgi:DHA1 family multidrug resistance protein-like MFS transporter